MMNYNLTYIYPRQAWLYIEKITKYARGIGHIRATAHLVDNSATCSQSLMNALWAVIEAKWIPFITSTIIPFQHRELLARIVNLEQHA